MKVYQCNLAETNEPIFLSEIQSVIEKSPFEHVLEFDNAVEEDGVIMGKNYEGRIVRVCDKDEIIMF